MDYQWDLAVESKMDQLVLEMGSLYPAELA